MNIVNFRFSLATLLVAGILGTAPALAQTATANDHADASPGQLRPLETAGDVACRVGHRVDGYCFHAGNLPATDMIAAPFHTGQLTTAEMAPDHYVGGGITSDSVLNLDAKSAPPLPGHVMLGGEWLHSPTDTPDGHPDHYVSGVLMPF